MVDAVTTLRLGPRPHPPPPSREGSFLHSSFVPTVDSHSYLLRSTCPPHPQSSLTVSTHYYRRSAVVGPTDTKKRWT